MKQLVKEDYNYFEWDGIEKGIVKNQNVVIKNGFEKGMSLNAIAFLVELTPKEVALRIKEMQLTRASRTRAGLGEAS